MTLLRKWQTYTLENPLLIQIVSIPLFIWLSIYNKDQIWLVGSITILLCHFFPAARLKILSVSFLFVGLGISNNFFSVVQPNRIVRNLLTLTQTDFTQLNLPVYVYKAVSFFCYFLFLILFRVCYAKIFKRFNILATIFILSVYALILVASQSLIDVLSLDFKFLLKLFLLILIKHIWYVFLLARFSRFKITKIDLNFLASAIMPFWIMTGEPREHFKLSSYFVGPEERTLCYRAGLRALVEAALFLLLAVGCLSLCKLIIVRRMPEMETLENFFTIFNSVFSNIQKFSLPEIWLILFFKGLCHVILLIYVYGQTFVGAARLCGVKLTDSINKPWKSTSFYDFIVRSMYYYNFIIETYFLYPLLELFNSFSSWRKVNLGIGIIAAVSLGGLIFHFMRDPFSIFTIGSFATIKHYFEYTIIYYLLLGTFIYLSILIEKKFIRRSFFSRAFGLIVYIQIYSLILLTYYPKFRIHLSDIYLGLLGF